MQRWVIIGREQPQQGNPLFDHLVGAGQSVGGTSRASAFATIRLTTRSNLVGGLRLPQNLVNQWPGAPLKSMKATVPTGFENSYFS